MLGRGGQVWELAAVDRFGDHGMVGVIAIEGAGGGACVSSHTSGRHAAPLSPHPGCVTCGALVSLVAVSCRVLALEPSLVFLSEALRVSGVSAPVLAILVPTERNGPCRSLFRDAGFERADGGADCGADGGADGGGSVQRWVLAGIDALPRHDADIYTVACA